jgi:hypothetical protein
MADVRIPPITPARFDDLADLFGTRGDPSWCWCTFFLTTGSSYSDSVEHNRAAQREHIATARHSVGLVAYAADGVGGSDRYHGAAPTLEAAGFEIVGSTGPTRPVMRLDL